MISVMLVDDEPQAIKYLRNLLDWSHYGFSIVATASNGKKALELAEQYRPQVIFSDIRMPIIDGLQLCEKVKKQFPETLIVLLSAYKDFQYAKQAIQFGVTNYMLKHELNPKTLAEELVKIAEEQSKQQYVRLLLREQQYKEIIMGYIHQSVSGDLNETYLCILIKKDMPLNIQTLRSDASGIHAHSLLKLRENLLLQKKCNGLLYWIDISIDSLHHLVLYKESKEASTQKSLENIHKCIQSLYDYLPINGQGTYSVAFASRISLANMSDAFRRLSSAIRYRVFNGCNSSICVQDKRISAIEPATTLAMDVKRLLQPELLEKYIQDLFSVVTYPIWNLSALRSLCRDLGAIAMEFSKELHIPFPTPDVAWTIEEIQTIYISFFQEVSTKYQKHTNFSKMVQAALLHIDKYYDTELTLDSLGEILNVNGVYFGQLFKKEVGKTFLTYLTSKRIQESQKLLMQETYNIAEVAKLVGYNSSQYFSKIFLKHTGCTPSDYRKKECGYAFTKCTQS